MVIKKKINDALNTQINEELYSSYLYLSMAAYFESINLKGFANWMKVQSHEEHLHAMKFFEFVHDAGGTVELKAISAPQVKWGSPLEAFEATLKHEQYITQCIYNLIELAMSEKDYATNNLLQWYVGEQVEEEATATEILQKLKTIGSSAGSLLYLDKEMKKRQ